MKINYNFAGINIEIESDFIYEKAEAFDDFINEQSTKSDLKIKVIKKTIDVSNRYLNVFDSIDYQIYKYKDILYRQYYFANKKKILSCFIQNKQSDGKYYC